MRRIHTTAVVALLAFALPALVSAQDTERVHKVVPLGPGGTVTLDNFSGDIRIVGADVNDVTIDAVRTASRDKLDRVKLDIQADGSSVVIQANKKEAGWSPGRDTVVRTDFDITVPRRAQLEVKAFSSGVHVRGVAGQQRIKTFSGNVDVEGGPARIRAKTFSGTIDVQLAPGATSPDLDLQTFSGRIGLRVPDGARAGLDFDSFSGRLTSEAPLTVAEQRKGHLLGAIGGGGQNRIRLKTFSGDVQIGR